MKKDAMRIIQTRLNYKFHNIELLKQAFSRSENDVLEFYGDRILSFALVNEYSQEYGFIANNKRFVSTKTTGILSQTLSKSVMNKNLAARMEKLGFADFYRQFANKRYCEKTIADLFEAILGAVAIDSNWNVNIIREVTLKLLTGFNLSPSQTKDNIDYRFELEELCIFNEISFPVYSEEQEDDTCWKISVTIKIDTEEIAFISDDFDKTVAAQNVYEAAYKWFYLETCKKVVNKKSTPEDQLNVLVANGLVDKPNYYFSIDHERGKSITCTKCELSFPSIDKVFCGYQDEQKKAKANAIAEFLFYLGLDIQGLPYESKRYIHGKGLLKHITTKYFFENKVA